MTPQEADLVKACLNKDKKAQRILFDNYSRVLFGLCLRYAKDRSEAHDMLQEGFMKIYSNLDKFRGDSKLETWMYRVMMNACLQLLKSKKDWLEYTEEDVELDNLSEEQPEFEESALGLSEQLLLEIIDSLPTGYRTVFNMYVFEGYTHKEIAEYLGISPNTSKTQLMKARKHLQEQIKNKSMVTHG